MISHLLSDRVYECLVPKPFIPAAEWVTQNVMMPQESKIRGAYRLDLFPHFREPFECFDDPEIERITVQTGAQIGKTAWALACLAKAGATDPHPMAFADADEKSTKRVIRRAWKFFERCPDLAELCPPPRLQASDHMELTTFEVHGAWAGSAASAADYGAKVVILNETDKMKQRSTDTEADFRWLMGERAKGFVGAKIIEISTPSLVGVSYIESQRLKGDNRRRMVPCPHCNHFQELITGNPKKGPGGVRFEKGDDGKLDAERARETAYYECIACQKPILEHHRYEMLNSGLWVPEGCHVTKSGKIAGQPKRSGRHASFGPVSTLHSLLPGVTIGVYAENLVSALTATEQRREAIRNFTNSWEGATFNPRPVEIHESDIQQRMGVDEPLGICPTWSTFLTLASDLGRIGDELIFYWWVDAWGPGGRGQLVDFGMCYGREQMNNKILGAVYPHADGGEPLRPVAQGFDSGSITNPVYEFCEGKPRTWPLKGSSKDPDKPFVSGDFIEMYRPGFKRSGIPEAEVRARMKTGNYDLIIVNTKRSQEWVEDRLSGLIKPTEPNWYSIPNAALTGQPVPTVNLARHLLGDVQDDRGNWIKRYEDQDFRDAWRYSVVMAFHYTQNGRLWNQLPPRQAPARSSSRSDDDRQSFVRKPRGGLRRR